MNKMVVDNDNPEDSVLTELSNVQQELLNVIYDEVSDLLVDQIKLAADLNNFSNNNKQLSEIVETQIIHAERIGSAAEMIGLQGLNKFCEHIKENFVFIKNTDPSLIVSLRSKILYWPDVTQTYLISPSDEDYINLMLDYLNQDEFPVMLDQQQRNDLEIYFNKSEIDAGHADYIHEATSDLVSLSISEDVDQEVFKSLMLDLTRQTEELSVSVSELQNDDFIKQLEISERIAHTLKSAGNTASISGVVNFTHHLEGIFSALLKAKRKPSNELHQCILNASDCIQEMAEFLQGIGPFPDQSIEVLQSVLDWVNKINLHGMSDQIGSHSIGKDVKAAKLDGSTRQAAKKMKTGKDVHIEPTLQISANLVDDLLKRAGENIISNEQIQELSHQLSASIQRFAASNEKVRGLAQELENMIELRGFLPQLDSYSQNEKFDALEVDQFNELHTFANQILESADDSMEFSTQIEQSALKLDQLSTNQVRTLYENQEAVLRIRMVPVKSILPRLKRSVRQASKLSGRIVELNISGEETLIDSEYINQLVDPIMHVLRNAIDHGIEDSEYRVKQGKVPEGKIQLSFKKEGNLIRVVCHDDGAGLDMKRIQSKAIANGLLEKNEKLTKELAIEFILRHGFSTKKKVSQLSGRGVGLAVVHTMINDLKGSVIIDSENGRGVKVDIIIPTTFNSVHALIVRCAENTVAISNRGVDEILFAGAGEIIEDGVEYFFQYEKDKYQLYDLQYLLEKVAYNEPITNKISLIIRDDTNKKFAVMIDEIFDTRDIITKPLSQFIPKISGLHGTTILGDGTVTAVIDIVELLNNMSSPSTNELPIKNSKNTQQLNYSALIVEDSISTRKSLAQFMRDLGFNVNTAKDGVEAIDQIQKQVPSVVLTDLEMPRMNGLELVNHLRANTKTAFTPIVIITSKSTEKHRKEAQRLGVSAYITKPYDEDELLTLIDSFDIAS